MTITSTINIIPGKPHELLNLGDLVTRLTEDIDVMRKAMLEKEQKLAALFKKTSKVMSEYEQETGEMIKLLHKTRDEQVLTDISLQCQVFDAFACF